MRADIHLVFCVMVVLTGSSQTIGQSSALPPALPSPAGNSASRDLTEDPGDEVRQRTHNPAGGDETSTPTSTFSKIEGTVHLATVTNGVYETDLLTTSSAVASSPHTNVPVALTPSAAAGGLSSTPTVQSTTTLQHLSTAEGTALLTRDHLTTFLSQPAHTVQDAHSTAHASTIQPQSESLTTANTQPTTTGHPLTSAPGRGPAVPTHWEVPSELNVGDEDLKRPHHRSSSPLDPLLAGLLSVFIVTTAIVFVVLFLRFRQRTNHPEFHRLQDLPMDDLMEDTPLSRYSH